MDLTRCLDGTHPPSQPAIKKQSQLWLSAVPFHICDREPHNWFGGLFWLISALRGVFLIPKLSRCIELSHMLQRTVGDFVFQEERRMAGIFASESAQPPTSVSGRSLSELRARGKNFSEIEMAMV